MKFIIYDTMRRRRTEMKAVKIFAGTEIRKFYLLEIRIAYRKGATNMRCAKQRPRCESFLSVKLLLIRSTHPVPFHASKRRRNGECNPFPLYLLPLATVCYSPHVSPTVWDREVPDTCACYGVLSCTSRNMARRAGARRNGAEWSVVTRCGATAAPCTRLRIVYGWISRIDRRNGTTVSRFEAAELTGCC